MLKGKSLTDFNNRFSPNNFQKFDKSLIVFLQQVVGFLLYHLQLLLQHL